MTQALIMFRRAFQHRDFLPIEPRALRQFKDGHMFFFNKIGDTKQIYTQSHTSTSHKARQLMSCTDILQTAIPDLSLRCNPRDEAETDPQ